MTQVNDEFKVGDKVYLLQKGVFGTVTNVNITDQDDNYPVRVEYSTVDGDDWDYCTVDGKYLIHDAIPMIYHDKVEFTFPKRKFTPSLIGESVVMQWPEYSGFVVGLVVDETEKYLTLEGRGHYLKSRIVNLFSLGEEIKL